jgi:hypothetical protein
MCVVITHQVCFLSIGLGVSQESIRGSNQATTNSIMRYHWQINNYSTMCENLTYCHSTNLEDTNVLVVSFHFATFGSFFHIKILCFVAT